MAPVLSVVIVSWNVRELLERALRSIYISSVESLSVEVIVVDNASSDGSVDSVRATFPDVRIIANTSNRGFPGANNQGLDEATGEFILLLNPDTEIIERALQTLVAYLQAHPDVGIVGPRLLNPDGTSQSSRRRFPTLPILFFESTWLQPLLPRCSLRHYYVEDQPDSVEHDVDWVTGAAMMVRREAVADAGRLDEGFFMYSEELDWCHRFRKSGWRIVFLPAAQVIHYGGRSSDQVVPVRHIYFQASKIRYTKKHHGRIIAEMLRTWLLGQYVWQSVVESLKWLVNHRRPLRAERIRAYLRVIGSGLRQPHGGMYDS